MFFLLRRLFVPARLGGCLWSAVLVFLFAGVAWGQTFYFNAGDPSVNTSWGNMPGGSGTNPTVGDFNTPGRIFIMETGKTGTLAGNLTFGVGTTFTMQASSTLNFGTGNLTLNGAINLGGQFTGNMTSTLTIGGSGAVTGTISSGLPLLQLGGFTLNRSGSMVSAVVSTLRINAGGFNLNAGTLSVLNPSILELQGPCAIGTMGVFNGYLVVSSGFTLMNSGSITIPAGNFFEIQGAAAIVGNPVSYPTATSSLVYSLTGPKTATDVEFPPTMNGQVRVINGATLTLNNNKAIAGLFELLLGAITDIGTNTLTLNGAINLSGGSLLANLGPNLVIGGSGTFTGNLTFTGTQTLTNFFLNRPSVTIPLGSPLFVNGQFTHVAGILQTTPTNILRMNSNNPALLGAGSATAYINGPLERQTAAGMSYDFPVGDATNYRAVRLNNVAGTAPIVRVSYAATGAASVDGTLMSVAAPNWRIEQITGTYTGATLERTDAAFTATSRWGRSAAQAGMYTSVSPAPVGMVLTSNTAAATAGYYAVGTVLLPTTFYFNAGDPANTANWGSNPGGTGTPPADFTTAGNTYIMETGKTGTLAGNLTFGMGTTFTMQAGSVLNLGTGNNLILNGEINLGGQFATNVTSTLTIGGSGAISGNLTFSPPSFIPPQVLGGLTINRTGSTINLGSSLRVNGAGVNLMAGTINYALPTFFGLGSNSTFNTGTFVTGGIDVHNGVMLTNNGTVSIPAGNNFVLWGSGTVTGNPINYLASSSTLYYRLTGNRGTSDVEFPTTMNSEVHIVDAAATLTLNNSKTVNQLFDMQNAASVDIGMGNTLTLNGAITTNLSGGGTITGGTNRSLVIGGTGTFTGNLNFSGAQQLQNFTINRAGLTIPLGSPLSVSGILALTNGILNTNGNTFTVSNTATNAISGGSATSYVQGQLIRNFLPNIAADGTSYAFPIGNASNYRPLTLQNIRTGAGTPLAAILLPTGTPASGTGLSTPFADANRIWQVNAMGPFISSELLLANLPALPGTARLGMGTAPTGAYNRINSTPSGTSISSVGQITGGFGTTNQFVAIGTNQQNTYSWNLPGNGSWTVPANWSPTRSTPLPDDIMRIETANTDLLVSNVPNETIGQLIIGGGNGMSGSPGKQLQAAVAGNTLTISGGAGDDVVVPASNTFWQRNALNISLQAGTSYVVNGGLLTEVAAIQGAGSFTLNGSLEIANADGLNGTSAGTGTIQNTGGITYNPTLIGFWGIMSINSNLGAVAGKPALTSFPNLYAGNGVTLNLTSSPTLTSKVIFTNAASRINIGANTLTTNDVEVQVAGGAFIGSATSNLTLTKTSALLNPVAFAPGGQLLNNLTMSGAGLQATLGSPLTIQGALNLTNGRLLTNGVNIPTLTPTASVSGGSATSYVEGPMARQVVNGGTGYLFPIGKAGTYLPLRWDNIGGAGTLESEAFAMGSGGGAGVGLSAVSGTEYWRSQRTAGTVMSGQLVLSRTAAIASGSVVGEANAFNGLYAGRGGTVGGSTITSNAITAFDGFYAIGGGLIYYYTSGDPLNPMNWNTQQNGMGVSPAALNLTGMELVIDGNRTVNVTMPFTLAMGVKMRIEAGSTLSVASGQAFTNNGTLEILGTLELQGNGDFAGTPPQYLVGTSPVSRPTLRYANGTPARSNTTDIELPASGFQGDLVINNPAGIVLPSAIALGTSGRLVLQNGILFGEDFNKLTITNPAFDAVSGGSSSSFVVASLIRQLPPNLNNTGNVYAFPIGARIATANPVRYEYTPFALTQSSTGTMGALIEVAAREMPLSVSPGVGVAALSQQESWQARVISGQYLGGGVVLQGRTVQSGNIVVFSDGSFGQSLLGTANGGAFTGFGFGASGVASARAVANLPFQFALATAAIPPAITAITPDAAGAGYEVIVEGSGLAGISSLTIGGMATPFRIISDNRIAFTPASNLAGTITVQSQRGTATSSQSFRFVPAPTLANQPPSIVSTGTVLLLNGTNFLGSTQSMNGSIPLSVSFGSLRATDVQILSATQLRVVVPFTTANVVAQMRITTAGGTIATASALQIVAPPVVRGFTPSVGGIGTTILVTGANFTNSMTAALLNAQGGGLTVPLTIISSSQASITLTGNENFGAQTPLTLNLTTAAGTVRASGQFFFVPPPRVDSVFSAMTNQAVTTLQSGVAVRILGQNLIGIRSITIGGEPALSVEEVSDREIIVRPGGGAAGVIRIEAAGGTVTSSQQFMFIQSPAISSIVPAMATRGSVVVLTGVNLALVSSVSFGGVPASRFTVVSPTRIEAVVGNGASGAVTASNGMFTITAPQTFTLAAPPVITAIQPARATAGTVITLLGENLNFIGMTSINDRAVQSVQIISSTEARVILGGNASSGRLSFETPFGTVLSQIAIDFVPGSQPLPPVIADVQPQEGIPGTQVTLTGNNFENITRVAVNGVDAQFSRTGSGTIVLAVPQVAQNVGAQGVAATITVVGAGQTVQAPQMFTFFSQVPVPSLASISPASGVQGTIITLSGENMNRVQNVLFGGVPATRLDATTATSIQAVIGNGASGNVELVLRSGERVPTQVQFSFTGQIQVAAPISPLQRDSAALVRLFTALGGERWTNRTGWLTNAPISTWFGVETALVQPLSFSSVMPITQANVRITGLRLPANGVTVSNPEVFAALFRSIQTQLSTTGSANTAQDSTALATLRVLDLSGNALDTEFPIDALLLFNLRTLNLANTRLLGNLGTLCQRLQQLPGANALALQNLDLSGNNLTGEIPSCLGVISPVNNGGTPAPTRYANLAVVNLSNNRFSGTIPASLLALRNIRQVNLQNNSLTGALPTLARTTQLAQNVSANNVSTSKTSTDKTSTEAHSAESLEVLNVAQNQLSGLLPREIAAFVSLKELNISRNAVGGEIPKEMGGMQALERLIADDNLLRGAIPEELARLRNLRTLGLANNALSEAPNLAQNRALDTLRLQGNRLLFADIAPNIAVRAFTFAPQDSTQGRALDTSVVAGSRLVLTARSTDGRAFGDGQTRFQWFKGGQQFGVLSTAPTLVFEVVARNDAGVYTCRITNLAIPNLAYQTQAITLRTTLPPAPTLAPQLVSPLNGAESLGIRPEFSWRTSQNATAYHVELAQNQAFTASQRDTVFATTATWRVPLSFGTQYWWRVRAVSAGGESPFSEVRTFVTTTRELSVTLDTVNFGKVPARDRAALQATVRNRGTAQITIKDITLQGDSENNFRIPTTVREVRLNPNENYSFEVDFTPRSAGEKVATVQIRYDAGTGQEFTTSLPGRLRGRASVLKIVPISFDTVRVGDKTFTSALVINRGTTTLRLRSAQIQGGRASVFSFDNALSARSLQIFPEDTSAVLMRCSAVSEGALNDVLRVEAPEDTAEAPIRATARLRRSTDVSAVIGFRTRVDSALPGANVVAELYIKSASPSLSDLYRANQPAVRATVRLNRNVLVAASTESRVRVIRNAEVASNLMRIEIPPFSWNGRDSVLTQFTCTAIAGDTAFTPLTIETLQWGAAAENRALRSNEQQIFLETAPVQVFKTSLCYEGGERLFDVSTKTALGVIQPNPSKDAALITLSLKDDDAITLTLYDVLGTPVQTVLAGKQAAGDHSVLLRTDALPSGAYFLVLRTRTSVHQQRVEVVR